MNCAMQVVAAAIIGIVAGGFVVLVLGPFI